MQTEQLIDCSIKAFSDFKNKHKMVFEMVLQMVFVPTFVLQKTFTNGKIYLSQILCNSIQI